MDDMIPFRSLESLMVARSLADSAINFIRTKIVSCWHGDFRSLGSLVNFDPLTALLGSARSGLQVVRTPFSRLDLFGHREPSQIGSMTNLFWTTWSHPQVAWTFFWSSGQSSRPDLISVTLTWFLQYKVSSQIYMNTLSFGQLPLSTLTLKYRVVSATDLHLGTISTQKDNALLTTFCIESLSLTFSSTSKTYLCMVSDHLSHQDFCCYLIFGFPIRISSPWCLVT